MTEARRIAAITRDPELRAAIARLGALVGAVVDEVTGSDGVRGAWRSADVVLVGADVVAAVLETDPARRPRVAVLTTQSAQETVWRATVRLGAVGLFVVPGDERDLMNLLTEAVDPAPATGSVIAVVGGCGGAGASTFAAALALAAAHDLPTALLDGDQLGGGLDVLLGVEAEPGVRWSELAGSRGRIDSASLATRMVQIGGCSLLPWDRGVPSVVPPDAVASVVDAAVRSFGLVVVDLPRVLDDVGDVLAATADRAVIVTLATVRAVAATASLAASLASRWSSIDLVVRDPGDARLSAAQVSGALGLPLAATIHSERSVIVAADRGDLPLRARGSLLRAAQAVLGTDLRAAAA